MAFVQRLLFLVLVCAATAGCRSAASEAQTGGGLQVEYGGAGIERILYRGVVLEDLKQNSADAFHIWHMKVTDLEGKPLAGDQGKWGENNLGRRWDSAAHTWTYRFAWGSIATHLEQRGDRLDIEVTEQNEAGSDVIVRGAVIYPLMLHFPARPNGFAVRASAWLAFNTLAPSVTTAAFGAGQVTAVVPEAGGPLYSGFVPEAGTNTYAVIVSGTAPDNLASFQPHEDRSVMPGHTERFTLSMRFAPAGTDEARVAEDAYRSWAAQYPATLHWPDRRMIGTVYLASSPASGAAAGRLNPANPRRYFQNSGEVDIRTTTGLERFQAQVLAQARANVDNLRRLGAQGAITWDIEGEQFPQPASYVCAPDAIAQVAPEMESVVVDARSPYRGMKLDDAYFKVLRDAGFRVGVCVRPQRFTLSAEGTAAQTTLPEAEVAAELVRKMRYAHDRWGATLFYLDSTVDRNGAPLDAGILQKAAAALPDSLLIPEESTLRGAAYTAPFLSFLFHGETGTSDAVRRVYPDAFSVNLINDADPAKLAGARGEMTEAVRHGDILATHVDYWQANNSVLVEIEGQARRK